MFTPDNLPNLLKEVEKFKEVLAQQGTPNLWKHLDQCQKAVQDVQESLSHPEQKKILGDLLGESAKARKELSTMMPALLADLQKQQEASLAAIQELATGIKKAEKDLEEKLKAEAELAAAVPPPAAAEVRLDPNHGADLAAEFLLAAGLLDKAVPQEDGGFDDAGSIARHWHEAEEAHEPAPAPPSPPVSPPPVAPTPARPGSGILKPKSLPPISRPRREEKSSEPKPAFNDNESLGKASFEDE